MDSLDDGIHVIMRRDRTMVVAAGVLLLATIGWLCAAAITMPIRPDGAAEACVERPEMPGREVAIDARYSVLPPGVYCWYETDDGTMREFAHPSWSDSLVPNGSWLAVATWWAITIVRLLRTTGRALEKRRRRLAAGLLVFAYATATAGTAWALSRNNELTALWLPLAWVFAAGAFGASRIALIPAFRRAG